jgi:hypothetical protein
MTDTEILDWLADNAVIEGFADVEEDIHEIAFELSSPWVSSPTTPDDIQAEKEAYRAALRELIAMATKAGSGKDAA